MFDNLVISNPKKQKLSESMPRTIMSATIHGLVVWLAVAATIKSAEIVEEATKDATMIFLTQEAEPAAEEPPPQQQVLQIEAPPKGFQTLAAPIDVPSEIPPIDLTKRFDPRDFSGVGQEGGIFVGVEGGTGPVDLTQTFLEAVVDDRPERLSGPDPRYPEMLRQAGVEGVVLLQYVIDTSGRVEDANIEILQSTNRAFEGPAREVIRRSLFRPGRVRGQAVRVLVQQQIGFTIQREEDE